MPSSSRLTRVFFNRAQASRLPLFSLCVLLVLAGCQTPPPREYTRDSAATDRAISFEQSVEIEPADEAQSIDIWERVRQGYQLQDEIALNPRIEQQRLWLASNTAVIQRPAERGSPYIHFIVEQLDARNMPMEIALLPVIESAYNPRAYSPGHAAGLWQFIPSTGRHFNLQQTNWYDGRRDITASTKAALNYLQRLHDMFNDDWLLALAAYNAGEGTVSRAIERNERLGLPTDYWNLQLPATTQDYVPKLLAIAQIVESPAAYGVKLPEIANEPYFEQVTFNGNMQLASVAQITDIDEDELYLLNPAYKKGITLDGPSKLLIPVEMAEQFNANLALLKDANQVDWRTYRVRSGDSLHSIANRYSLTVKTLKEINNLSSNSLSIGQVLNIPGEPAKQSTAVLYQPNTSKAVSSYQVKHGDNLWLIAKSQKVSVANLKQWNNLKNNHLKVGQRLTLRSQP